MKTMVKALWILLMASAIAVPARAEDVKRMTKEELKSMLGSPDLVVVDVRREGAIGIRVMQRSRALSGKIRSKWISGGRGWANVGLPTEKK
jgi:hypothetical protein